MPNIKPTVILVEDETDLRDSLQLAFRSAGFTVKVFDNGGTALDFVQTTPLNGDWVLVSDIMMPKVSGMDLIRAAKDKWPGLPVVAMTGYGDKPMITDLLRMGCDDFLDKPFDTATLLTAVQRVMAQQKARDHDHVVRLRAVESMQHELEGHLAASQTPPAAVDEAAGATPDIPVDRKDDRAVVTPAGDLVGAPVTSLRHQLETLLSQGVRCIRLDLAQVHDLDALALSVFCALAQEMRNLPHGRLEITNVTAPLHTMFRRLSLDGEFLVKCPTNS